MVIGHYYDRGVRVRPGCGPAEQCVAGIIGPIIYCSSHYAAKVTGIGGNDVLGRPIGHDKLVWGPLLWVPLAQALV